MTPRRWIEYLIAILVGNAIYFAVILPAMPGLSHEPFRLDLGLLVNFAICVLVYVAIRLGSRHARARWENTASDARSGRSTDRASEKK
ncbi:MAG TPA: hypothetical protein VKG23_00835 [Thermoanaerobaculia bacterium]|nr:hypothetical protein [Thermoanaerobaculia bacterium]